MTEDLSKNDAVALYRAARETVLIGRGGMVDNTRVTMQESRLAGIGLEMCGDIPRQVVIQIMIAELRVRTSIFGLKVDVEKEVRMGRRICQLLEEE
jgi:hypothetical protein